MAEKYNEKEIDEKLNELENLYEECDNPLEILNKIDAFLEQYPDCVEFLQAKIDTLAEMDREDECETLREKIAHLFAEELEKVKINQEQECLITDEDFSQYLMPKEKLLKKIVPLNTLKLSAIDVFLCVFLSLFASAIIALWTAIALTAGFKENIIPISIMGVFFFGIVSIIFYFIGSRIKEKFDIKNGKILYLITNKRVCIVRKNNNNTCKFESTKSSKISRIDFLNDTGRTATVLFGGEQYLSFHNIENAYDLYRYASRMILGTRIESYEEWLEEDRKNRKTALIAILFILFLVLLQIIY